MFRVAVNIILRSFLLYFAEMSSIARSHLPMQIVLLQFVGHTNISLETCSECSVRQRGVAWCIVILFTLTLRTSLIDRFLQNIRPKSHNQIDSIPLNLSLSLHWRQNFE